jgi:hypothetical protein
MTVTELTTYQPPLPPSAVVMVDYQTRAMQQLGAWVQSADAAYQVAQRLVQSSFVPQAFRPRGDSESARSVAAIEATAAILAGSEVGLSPMAALRAFDVIQGTAAPRAITLRAIVQSFGHEMVLKESTATRCIMIGRRRGATEWQQSVWTIDRAKDMQLTGKDNWKKQPGAMLVARATSEIARLIAADAILGIGYTAEEISDGADASQTPALDVPVEDEPAPPAATRRMSRPKPAPVEEPSPETGEMLTKPQLAKIAALMREAQMTDRDDALAYVGTIIGHPIESRNDLTKSQASDVIDRLEADLAAMGQPDADEQQMILDAERDGAGQP